MNPIYLVAALASVFYGGADFYGGLSARRAHPMVVTFVATLAGMPVLVAGLWIFRGQPVSADYAWGAAAGVAGGAAAAFIFYAIALGPVSVASPVLALTGMSLPVLVGVLLGDRPGPIAIAGIAMLTAHHGGDEEGTPGAAPASADEVRAAARKRVARVLGPSLIAGVLAGGFLVCVGRIGPHAGIGPLVLARVVSAALFAIGLLLRRAPLWPPAPAARIAISSGLLDAAANTAYLFAAQRGALSLVAALASLGPATTVLLARGLLNERWSRTQIFGLALALAAGLCISLG